MKLTQKRVQEAFDYIPESGDLLWKIVRPGCCSVGEQAGTITWKGYRRVSIDGIRYQVHRICFLHYHGYLPEVVDHINRDKLDNRICNLRGTTNSKNSCNRKAAGKSKYIGVSPFRDKWRSQIKKDGEVIYLGLFKTELLAAKAYNDAATKLHGEFASLNT